MDGGGVKGDLVAVVTGKAFKELEKVCMAFRRLHAHTYSSILSGTLPPAPGGLWTPPYVADYTKFSSRYLSLSSYDLQVPGAW